MVTEKPVHLKLQHSESVVLQVAAQLYSAYIIAGRIAEGEEATWMERAIREAISMAVTTDAAVISDDEISGQEGRGGLRSRHESV
jgi:hypothetical protein